MSDNLVPENDLPVSSSNEVPESDLPSTSTPKAQSKTAGAIAGAAIGAPVSSGIAAKQTISAIADAIRKGRAPTPAPTGTVSVSAAPPVPTAAAAAAPELVGNEKWLSKLSGGQTLPGGQMAAEDLAKARDMARAIGPGGPLAGGQNVGGVLLGPKTPAELKAEAAAAREAQIVQEAEKRAAEYLAAKEAEAAAKAAKPTALQTAGKILTPTGVAGKVLNTVAPVLSLAGAGAGAVDAANRWQHGDYGRSIVSGLGAIGSAASMIPHPVTRAVGTGAALLAPAINYGIDTLIGREGYADGGDVGPYVGYPQIKNKPRDPNFVQQSGPFLGGLDAIIGMGPRSDVSMLTPQGQAYHEAYQKMEPAGIAANVLPFIGGPTKALGKSAVRTLGPKAADMAENYLARIGGLQYAVPPSNAPAARTLVEPTAEEIAKFQPKPTTHGKLSDFLQNHMDEYLGLHQSDRLGTHGDYMGGTGFTNFQNINPLHAKNEVVWMNMTPEASNKIIANNQINGKNVVWSNYIGKTDQHKSNRGVFNEILADVYKNNPNISPDQAALINARMKAVTGRDLDIRDKFLMQEEGGNTFDARGNLSKMFGEGFGRGKGKTILSPNYQSILNATEEEFTKGAPTSAIGTRLHRVYNEPSQFSTAFHPDYDYTVHGKDLGVQFPAVPHTVLDWTQKYIKEGRGGKGSTLPHGNAWFNYMSNPQHINEPFVKRVQAEGFAPGGKVLSGLANFIRHPHGQDAKVAQALEQYLKGNISQEERIRILNDQLPIRKWNELPPNYTDDEIRNALMSNKQPKALVPVPAGMRVGNRLDIPAYTQKGVYVDTTHDLSAGNAPISYNRTGHLTDVDFSSKPDKAVRVGLGTQPQALTPMAAEWGADKSPFALIKGTNVGTSDDEVRRMMAEMMKDPNYTQIGMDPRRHSQFYDKSTGMPVWSAEEKLQSGPLIIAPKKGLETTSWDDPRLNLTDFPGKKYANGGEVTAEPTQQDIISKLIASAKEQGHF